MSLPIVPLAAAAAALMLFGSSSSAQASAPPATSPPRPRPSSSKPSAPKKPAKSKPAKASKPASSSSSAAPGIDDAEADIQAAARAAAATLEAQMVKTPSGGKVLVMPPQEITAQVPTASAAPHAALAPKPQPPGYNPQAARREAASLASHLKRSGKAKYDRRMLEAWQKKAGVIPDRIYGGASRGALRFYGVADPPLPFYPPMQEVPFVPPEKR